ncbi:MAG TPA: septum formation initiator family protein [Dehalococcoidia bacterium]|nr:septum formation initiator family protein [Dehalococcoidia bacterium]
MLALTAVIVGYFLVTGTTTALQSRQLSEREDRLQAEISDAQQRYHRLDALRQYLDSNEYIEAVAREELGLVRRGETSIVVIPTVASPTPGPGEADGGDLWWEALIR